MKKFITVALLFSGIFVVTIRGIKPDVQQQLDDARSRYDMAIASLPVCDEWDQDWFNREQQQYASAVAAILDAAGTAVNSQEKREVLQGLQKNDSQ